MCVQNTRLTLSLNLNSIPVAFFIRQYSNSSYFTNTVCDRFLELLYLRGTHIKGDEYDVHET